jgi:hypothetical protein
MRKVILFFLLFSFPLVIGINHPQKIYGKYTSQEGILFVSYSEKWNTKGLKALHDELLKNRHGEEIYALKEVMVYPEKPEGFSGIYIQEEPSIILFYGNQLTKVSDYQRILSHEYGHHIQNIYFPEIPKNTTSKWFRLRGLEAGQVYTGYCDNLKKHDFYLSEIFAEDYVILYGHYNLPNNETDSYLYNHRIQHQNQSISNVMEQKDELNYLERTVGWKINQDGLAEKLYPDKILNDFFVTKGEMPNDIKYYLRIVFYEKQKSGLYKNIAEDISLDSQIHDHNDVSVDLNYESTYYSTREKFTGIMRLIFTTVNIHSGRSVDSSPIYISAEKSQHFQLLCWNDSSSLYFGNSGTVPWLLQDHLQ